MAKVSKLKIQKEIGTDRSFIATWSFSKEHLSKYTVTWYYATGNGVWFNAGSSDITIKQSTYTAPENALKIKINVKPVSKTYKKKVNGKSKTVSYWKGEIVSKTYEFPSTMTMPTPSAPTVSIERYYETGSGAEKADENKYKMVCLCRDVDEQGRLNYIEYYIHKNSSAKPTYQSGYLNYDETVGYEKWVQTVDVGSRYQVRSRFFRKENKKTASEYSPWSDIISTPPNTPVFNDDGTSRLVKISNNTAEVVLYYNHPSTATSVTIEYTYDKKYFNSNSSEVQSWTSDQYVTGVSHAEITGIDLSKGNTWYFRAKASNETGDSYWSDPIYLVLGDKPGIPTTWSSVTYAVVGEDVTLYWVHNAEDCSTQTSARIELDINGTTTTVIVDNPYLNDEENKDKTLSYSLDTTNLEDATVQWRVQTAGAMVGEYGDWSITRTIEIHAKPTLSVELTDAEGNPIDDVITSFPFFVNALPGPPTQAPIGYHVVISSDEDYTDIDSIGNEVNIAQGQVVYSKYFDTNYDLTIRLTPTELNLQGGVTYTLNCIVSMNSGLTAEFVKSFSVEWEEESYDIDGSIIIDEDRGFIAKIMPSSHEIIETSNDVIEGDLNGNVVLSVYRREFDGTFTAIETDIENDGMTVVVDPHPALDYARYRLIATSKTTGSVTYEDIDEPVFCNSVIIQWDGEDVRSYSDDTEIEDEPEVAAFSGELLRIPYNIDVSDNNSLDVSLVKYIGRSYPVTYYGTQISSTSTWNVEIPKTDTDTLYQIRMLSKYTGDVYVREPSGTGYWANVTVSYSIKHREVVVPITFQITRVEGGK